MSLISLAQGLAKNIGLAVPNTVTANGAREWVEFVHMANQEGEELARRVDWGQLTAVTTLTGTGANQEYTLPARFSRVVKGIGLSGNPRPLTRAEWASLAPVEGVPRYYLLEGNQITLWPYLASGETVDLTYQSDAFTNTGGNAWTADDETSLIDEDLFLKGLIVRWRRQKGMDYADYEAEYEATLADIAGFDDRTRLT